MSGIKKIIKNDYDYLMIFFIIFIFFLDTGIYLNDYNWHSKVGEWIIANKAIPNYGILSWLGESEHLFWTAQEWLSQILLYFFGQTSYYGPFYLTLIMSVVLIILIMNNIGKHKVTKDIFVFSATSIVTIYSVSCPRPQLFSNILLMLTLTSVYKWIQGSGKSILFLPLFSLLWINFHAGSANLVYIVPIITIIAIALGNLLSKKIERIEYCAISKTKLVYFVISLVISFLCLFLNPAGAENVLYPYVNMADSYMLSHITEWYAPDVKNVSGLLDMILVLIPAIRFVFTKKKIRSYDLLLYLFFVYLFFRSVRFSVYLPIICSFFIGYYNIFEEKKEMRAEEKPVRNKETIDITKFFNIIPIVIILILVAYPVIDKDAEIYNDYISISDELVEAIKEDSPEHLYNTYNLGGILISNDIKSFIDERYDLFGDAIISQAVDLGNMNFSDYQDADDIISMYDFDAFVLENTLPLNAYLQSSDEYILSYEDEQVNYYTRKE